MVPSFDPDKIAPLFFFCFLYPLFARQFYFCPLTRNETADQTASVQNNQGASCLRWRRPFLRNQVGAQIARASSIWLLLKTRLAFRGTLTLSGNSLSLS